MCFKNKNTNPNPKNPLQTKTKNKKRKKATFKLHNQSEDMFKDHPYPQTVNELQKPFLQEINTFNFSILQHLPGSGHTSKERTSRAFARCLQHP